MACAVMVLAFATPVTPARTAPQRLPARITAAITELVMVGCVCATMDLVVLTAPKNFAREHAVGTVYVSARNADVILAGPVSPAIHPLLVRMTARASSVSTEFSSRAMGCAKPESVLACRDGVD